MFPLNIPPHTLHSSTSGQGVNYFLAVVYTIILLCIFISAHLHNNSRYGILWCLLNHLQFNVLDQKNSVIIVSFIPGLNERFVKF